MLDSAISILVTMGAVLLLGLAWRAAGQKVAYRFLLAALSALAIYAAIVLLGGSWQKYILPPLAEGFRPNWTGKLMAITASLGLILLVPGMKAAAGFRFQQNPGSLVPAMICTAMLCAFSWTVAFLLANGTDLSTSRLLFQATLPGLDEELFYRGILLALMLFAFEDKWKLVGAPVGPAVFSVTLIFGMVHAVAYQGGELRFDPAFFGVVALMGFGLVWIRQRTGSLLMPILAHNLVNLGNSFF
jgi:uncharacterized protein